MALLAIFDRDMPFRYSALGLTFFPVPALPDALSSAKKAEIQAVHICDYAFRAMDCQDHLPNPGHFSIILSTQPG